MREILTKMVGTKIDLFCGGTSSLRGKLVKVDEGVAHMVDEDDQMFYVSIERIIVFSETKSGDQRAGFTVGFRGKRRRGSDSATKDFRPTPPRRASA